MKDRLEDLKRFLRETKAEVSKVTWPTWPELKGSTILVIIISVFFAIYIGIIDFFLSFVRVLF